MFQLSWQVEKGDGVGAGDLDEIGAKSLWVLEFMLCSLYFIQMAWETIGGISAGEEPVKIRKPPLNKEWYLRLGARSPGRL